MSADDGVWVKVWPDSVGVPEATITAITGSGVTHTYGDFVAYEFLTSGSLTCTDGLIPEALIVGAGGSGAAGYGSGAGAGALLNIQGAYLTAATQSVIVAASVPGRPVTYEPTMGVQGNTSILGDYFSPGGAGGTAREYERAASGWNVADGRNGGSGGGASAGNTGATGVAGSGGSGLPGVGGDGGAVGATIVTAAAGGGGAAIGSSGSGVSPSASSIGGAGGAGRASSITGSSVIYAGGGGGSGNTTNGLGGSGGGGSAHYSTGVSGTVNLGGGGGGSYSLDAGSVGGAGGSGVVIIKVKATNAANVDKSGWIEVTEAMLAAAAKKREVERKALAKKAALLAKTEELSGATQTDIKETK